MSARLCEYTSLDEIRDRLEVLYAKAERVTAYNRSVAAGSPDGSLLDEKQLAALAKYRRQVGDNFPRRVAGMLGRTIDVLEARRVTLERSAG